MMPVAELTEMKTKKEDTFLLPSQSESSMEETHCTSIYNCTESIEKFEVL